MRALIDGLPHVPKTCTWELTLRCNLRCGHCGSRAGQPRADEMPLSTQLRVTQELAALGCKRISLSGGEPTLSPNWQAIASEGSRLGVHMNMITNAACGGPELVRQARDSGLCNLGVSLDGLEESHDRIRGVPGLYGRVLGLLDDCAAGGLSVGVITTLWKGNFRQLDALHELLTGRVFVWQIQLGAAMGNLRDNREQQIDPEDLLEIVPTLARIVRQGKTRIHIADNIGYFGPYEETLRKRPTSPSPCWLGCYAGCRHIGIEANGGVKGCLSIQASDHTEGNLQQGSLREIWERPGAFAYNRDFQLSQLTGFCRTCEHAEVCRGGCFSMRTCEGGRENPFCYHRVATLAERAAQRRRPRYVPMAVAPAALLALFGLGCGGSTTDDNVVPVYGVEADAAADVQPSDGDAEASPPIGDAYGIADQDADASPPVGDAYGVPADVVSEPPETELYGLPTDEAGPPMGDAYGIPVESGPPVADAYGVPADAGPDTASWYGMPDP